MNLHENKGEKVKSKRHDDKLGKQKEEKVFLSVDDSVEPVALKSRRVPFNVRKKV